MEFIFGGTTVVVKAGQLESRPNQLRFHVALIREDDDSVSIYALNLPGVCSCGEDEQDALENIKEAAQGVIASYRDDGRSIPWLREADYDDPLPDNIIRICWIVVDCS